MPKDITHWIIAEKVFEKLDNTEMIEIINKYKHLYYIGAISFDIPYYCLGKKSNEFTGISDNLHNPIMCSPLGVISNMLQEYSNEVPEYVIAFILGTITHIVVDDAFHPLVYNYTGNYFDNDERRRDIAISNHREFESRLDLYFKKTKKLDNSYLMIKSYFHRNISKNDLLELLCVEYFNNKNIQKKGVYKTLSTYSILQFLFNKKIIYFTLKNINKVFKNRFSKVLTLFYPLENTIDYDFYINQIQYQHPITGEVFSESIIDIEEKAISKTISLFNVLAKAKTKTELLEILKDINIPSLKTGLGKYTSKNMKYFKID